MAERIDGDNLGIEWDGVERRVDNKPKLFGISLTNAIQVVVLAVTIGVVMLSLRQDMAEMKISMESNNVAHHEIMLKLVEVQSHVVAMQSDLLYNRDRLDSVITGNTIAKGKPQQ